MTQKLFTIREAAAILFGDEGAESKLRLRAWRGQFPTVKWGGRVYVTAEALDHFLRTLPSERAVKITQR